MISFTRLQSKTPYSGTRRTASTGGKGISIETLVINNTGWGRGVGEKTSKRCPWECRSVCIGTNSALCLEYRPRRIQGLVYSLLFETWYHFTCKHTVYAKQRDDLSPLYRYFPTLLCAKFLLLAIENESFLSSAPKRYTSEFIKCFPFFLSEITIRDGQFLRILKSTRLFSSAELALFQ